MKSLEFITAIPLDVKRGSGCFVGIQTLERGIRALGGEVDLVTPQLRFPVFTLERIVFNEQLRFRSFHSEATVGFDLDGYRVANARRRRPHFAAIKGVLGDAVRFETGFTRASLALQARLERLHARRSDRVITISRYCAERLDELYGVRNTVVVPELIDLADWRALFATNPAPPRESRFTVLCVCRFYPRKRIDLLLRAASILRDRLPELELRIVGDGPEAGRLRKLSSSLQIEKIVNWIGNTTAEELAREYNRADVFCLPSAQEGFGIVFLEAMAAGKAIVAASAAAVPEVVEHGLLVEPENAEALAEAIQSLYSDSHLRQRLGASGERHVENYEMKRVAAQFLAALD